MVIALLSDITEHTFVIDRLQSISSLLLFVAILILIKSRIFIRRNALYRQRMHPLNIITLLNKPRHGP